MKLRHRGALLVAAILITFGIAAPAQASIPPVPSGAAYLQRSIFLGRYGGYASILADPGRHIYLAAHSYLWTNTFYDRTDTNHYDESRVLYLNAGWYYWQCAVVTDDPDTDKYVTACFIYNDAGRENLDDWDGTATPNSHIFQTCKCQVYNGMTGEWFTWRSVLVQTV